MDAENGSLLGAAGTLLLLLGRSNYKRKTSITIIILTMGWLFIRRMALVR